MTKQIWCLFLVGLNCAMGQNSSGYFNPDRDPAQNNCSISCNLEYNNYFHPLCIPKGYNKFDAPSKNLKVFANVVLATRKEKTEHYNDLKNIDIHKMVLTYAPRLVLSWYDERLEHCDHFPRSLNRKQISRLWTPRIAVENHLERITGYLDARKLSIPSCSVS